MPTQNILAFDFGAESGRAVLGAFDGRTIQLKEVHRFPNKPVRVGRHFHWNVLALWDEITTGIRKAAQENNISSIGIDTWAVDFALLDANDELIGNPYHYRDSHTDGILDEAFKLLPRAEIYAQTGLQFLQFNTLYQLFAMQHAQSPKLQHARSLLMIPDLFHFWLTGIKACEFTNATTTQFYNPRQKDWARDVLDGAARPGAGLAHFARHVPRGGRRRTPSDRRLATLRGERTRRPDAQHGAGDLSVHRGRRP